MAKRKEAETPAAAEETPPAEGSTGEASEQADVETGEVLEPKGPLSTLQEALQGLLDYDQITEVRLALYSREAELEKHAKKGSDLGVQEEDARRRLRVIRGSDTRFGLTRIFAEAIVTEQRDVFFDREKPNGRRDGDFDATITFRTVDGRDITCTLEQLELADKILELRALYRAGILPSGVEKAIRDGDFWHLIEADDEEWLREQDEAGRAIAEASGVAG